MKKGIFYILFVIFGGIFLYGCGQGNIEPVTPAGSAKSLISIHSADYENTLHNIARIELNTGNKQAINTKEQWRHADLQVISQNSEIEDSLEVNKYKCEYKGHGNTTWNFPKKPFIIKFDEKTPLLGMADAKKFVFIANYIDRSAIRNSLTYYIANLFTELNHSISGEYLNTGWMWSPSFRYADVYINGQYAGLYLVTEKISISDNHLKLVEQSKNGTLPIMERGLLFELSLNSYNWETTRYIDQIKNTKGVLPYNVKEPDYKDDLTEEEQLQVRDYISSVEDTIFAPKSDEAWKQICKTIDITSFADYWIVQAIAINHEIGQPKSVFMYKNNTSPELDEKNADMNGGKLYAGPVWDFDWGTYKIASAGAKYTTSALYYSMLFEYEEFKKKVAERFELIKPALLNDIPQYIDECYNLLAPSVADDDNLFPWETRSGINPDSTYTYSDDINQFKEYMLQRVTALEKQINAMNESK